MSIIKTIVVVLVSLVCINCFSQNTIEQLYNNKKFAEAYEAGVKSLKKSPKDIVVLKVTAKSATELLLDKEAVELYTNAIKFHSNDAELYYLLAVHHGKFARRNLEAENYLKALSIKKDYTEIYSPLSYSLTKLNQYKLADSISSLALNLNQNDYKAKFAKAISVASLGNIIESRKRLRELLSTDPYNREVLYNLGLLEENQKNYTEALLRFERILEKEPNDLESSIRIGVIYFNMGLKTESKNLFSKLLKKFPNEALLLKNLAEFEFAQGNINAGKSYYFKVFEADKSPNSYFALAELYAQLGETDSAIYVLSSGVEKFPQNFDLSMELAKYYGNTKQFDNAIRVLKNIEKSNSTSVPCLFNLSLAYQKKGFIEEALTYINKAISLTPKDQSSYLLRVKSEIILAKGDYINARKILKQAVEINPKDEVSWYNLGVIHVNKNEHEEAKMYLERALEINPNYSECRKVYIRFLVGAGKLKEALVQCELLRNSDPFGADDYKQAIDAMMKK